MGRDKVRVCEPEGAGQQEGGASTPILGRCMDALLRVSGAPGPPGVSTRSPGIAFPAEGPSPAGNMFKASYRKTELAGSGPV